MIARYTNPEMGRIWSEQRKYETWLQVEVAAAGFRAGDEVYGLVGGVGGRHGTLAEFCGSPRRTAGTET